MVTSLHRVLRFPCLLLLGCAALLGSLVRCDDTYRAEVYVVGSNPQDYGVSVVTTTYPATVMNTNQAADESKPHPEPTSAPSSSSSSSSPDNNTPSLSNVSTRPADNHRDTSTISTSETPCRTSTDHKEELISSPTRGRTGPCKAEVTPPSRSPPVGAPVVSDSRARTTQQMPCGTCCQTRETNNIQCRRNARTPTEGTVDANNRMYKNLNAPTTCCSMLPKQDASGQKETQTQSDHPKPVNYTKTDEVPARYSPFAENGVTDATVNSIVTAEDATPNEINKIYGKTNPCFNNNSKLSQRAQNTQQSSIQPAPTDQTRQRVPQIPTTQEKTIEGAPFSQSATIHQPSINQTGGPTQAVINQMLVLPPNPANKTEDVQEPQINPTNVNQPTLTTPPNTTELTQALNNRTEFSQIQTPTKIEAKHEIMSNQTEINQTATETNRGVTLETNTSQEILEHVTNQTFPSGYNQTQTQTTETGTEIPPNQTESILPEIRKLQTNNTRLARSLNRTRRETALERRSRRKRAIAREKSESMAANQTELNQTEIINKEPNGPSLPRALSQAKSETQMEGRLVRDRSPKDPSRWQGGGKPTCTCVEEVLQRTALCREPCTRNAELTHTLFVNAAVILVIYILLLAFVYREFRRRRRAEEEWRRDAINWMCRERGMRWLAKMFS